MLSEGYFKALPANMFQVIGIYADLVRGLYRGSLT